MNIREVKRVLLIRHDKIGDLLLSTPFIHSIKQAIPWAQITLVVSAYAKEAVEGSGLVDELLIWEDKETPEKISAGKWEVAVALAPVTEAYKMAYASKAAIRAGIVYPERPMVKYLVKTWLNRPLFFNLRQRLARKDKIPHEIEQLEQLFFYLGLTAFDREMVLNLASEAIREGEQKIREKAVGFSGGVIGIQLAGRWLNRDWQIPQLSELLLKLRYDFPDHLLAVFYGPQEEKMGEELYRLLKEKPGMAFFSSQSFFEWAAKIKQLTVLITPDSGGLHLASALKVPVAALYLSDTYQLCSQQWAPWRVPHLKIKLRDFKSTYQELSVGMKELLKTVNVQPETAKGR